MSLLLEALKKAERAKEEAQRRVEGAAEPDAAPAEPSRPLMTRDQLPEISQTLEIMSDEPAPAAPAPPPEPEQPPEPAARPRGQGARQAASRAQPPAAEAQDAGRATARKVFEAKFREPNPRMPFYITMGALGAFAVGTVIYFYLELRPPPSLVNLNPPPAAQETAAAAPAASNPVAATRPIVSASAAPSIPGLPGAAAPQAPAAPVAKPPAAAAPLEPRQVPAVPPPARRTPPRSAPAPLETPAIRPPLQVAPMEAAPRSAPAVHPRIQSGYAAYQVGDLAAARTDYAQALQDDPANRDALLGMAAIDVRAGRYEVAEASYLRLLQADPRDAHAQAALIALRGGRQDTLVAESRVKSLLADDPGAHVLNFALGNQFARQGRWAEAQQEYFKAAAAEPDNADFAYNLAVSLDHLRQPRLALEHYQRALALAEKRGASFDPAAARARVSELGK